jgi:hypothetical protein
MMMDFMQITFICTWTLRRARKFRKIELNRSDSQKMPNLINHPIFSIIDDKLKYCYRNQSRLAIQFIYFTFSVNFHSIGLNRRKTLNFIERFEIQIENE